MAKPKKALTLWLLLCFALSLFPTAALAGDGQTAGPVADAKVSLEQAIQTVKSNFPIPNNLSEFNYSYDNYTGNPQWYLNWNSKPEGQGYFSAQVDAQSGLILGMNHWSPGQDPVGSGLQIPAVSREQAKAQAQALLKKLAPDYAANLKLVDPEASQTKLAMPPWQSGTHLFYWERVANGIPFPLNGASISISTKDGSILNYSLNWTKDPLPTPANVLTPEQARQAFIDNQMVKPQYLLNTPIRPMDAANGILKGRLVYSVQNGGMIDAVTGQPAQTISIGYGGAGGEGGMGGNWVTAVDQKTEQAPVPLTPEEQKEIDRSLNLIGQEKAIESVKQWLTIPPELTLRSANLSNGWLNPKEKTWHFYWSNEPAQPHRYMSARVNALNGELLSFDLPGNYQGTPVINREQAKKMAQEFLAKIQPQRQSQVKLNDIPLSPLAKYPAEADRQPIQSFSYIRIANGIEFPSNYINLVVDTVSKQIIGYNMEWGTYNLPSPQGMLTTAQAADAFFKYRPLTLSYTLDYQAGPKPAVRLVYQLQTKPNQPVSDQIDAKTGQPLDWQGKPLQITPVTPFNDLDNVADKDAINYLGQSGIFREYGESFHPAEPVTAVSFYRALIYAKGYHPLNQTLSDEEVFNIARSNQWLQEQLTPSGTLTRQFLAKVMVRAVNLQRAAEIKDIYRIDYSDAAAIAPESIGYVAIAKGLNMVKGNGNTYEPLATVTRAEAAVAIYNCLKVKP